MNGFTASVAWLQKLNFVFSQGSETESRNGLTREVVAHRSMGVDMRFPLMTVKKRRLSYQFAAAEALWIMNGDDRVESIKNYAPSICRYSDDGVRFFGAYGPRVADQLAGVIDKLEVDATTRQAVISMWRSNPPETKDVPCTLSVQWMERDGKLHCIDTMRSSDLWLGWSYDVFSFSMLSALILLELRDRGVCLGLGNLWLVAGSSHIYEHNWSRALQCLDNPEDVFYEPLDLAEFKSEIEFREHLQNIADRRPLKLNFLKELV